MSCLKGNFASCQHGRPLRDAYIPVVSYTAEEELGIDSSNRALQAAEKQGHGQYAAVRTRHDDERPFFDVVQCEYWDDNVPLP